MNKELKVVLFCFVLLSGNICAQDFDDVRNINRHQILFTKWNFSDFFSQESKWNWDLDVVYRRQSDVESSLITDNPLRLSIRPWIGYQFAKLTRVSISPIGWVNSMERTVTESDLPVFGERELRSTLQINNNAYYGRYNFTHRIRFESRWRALDQPEVRQNFRLRYRLRTRIPLNNDYFYVNNTVYLNLYSEVHVEFGGDFSSTNHLSQSRNYAGIGYRFWDWARLELGYLHQYMPRSNFYDVDLLFGPMFYLYIDLMSRIASRR
ncbi:MAG: DUF2490 domain-containing protein [Flavobacteriales bacterium]|nr:MAG: DUF2490 domain-containing protein [Flavobacteriales bacterium]